VDLLKPVTMPIGSIPLRDLSAHDLRRALAKLAEERLTRTMASARLIVATSGSDVPWPRSLRPL